MPFRGHNKSHLLVVYYCLKDFLLPPFCLKQSLMFGFHVGFHTNELQVVGRSWNENFPASHSFLNFLHLKMQLSDWSGMTEKLQKWQQKLSLTAFFLSPKMLEIITTSELLDFKWLIGGACPQTSFYERGGGVYSPFSGYNTVCSCLWIKVLKLLPCTTRK